MTEISNYARQILRLAELPGVGSVSIRRMIMQALKDGSLIDVDDARKSIVTSNRASKSTSNLAEVIENKCHIDNIGVISALDDDYPPALRHIEDFPPILYYKGNKANLRKISAAVVGTREASRLGLSWAKQISEILVRSDFSIVSGLALGIDTAGHEGALRAHGSTVAILAHGLHQVTPASNRDLAMRILEQNGTIIAEHPPGVPPRRAEYVRRNRIQSGMSVCSIVVESGDVGGAIHQGNFTKQQGRRLFCVVPDKDVQGATEFKYGGAQRLQTEAGAIPIRNRGDLDNIVSSGSLYLDFQQFNQRSLYRGGLLI